MKNILQKLLKILLNEIMEVYPLFKYSSIIFKLPSKYISYANLYVELVNIDDSNDKFEFYNIDNSESSITIPHKLYSTSSEIIEIIIDKLKQDYSIESSFENQIFKIETKGIYIKYNEFTKFIQMNEINKLFNENEYYVNLINLNKPSEFYVILTTSIDKFMNDSKNTYKTVYLNEGFNNITINFQNEYNDLYLFISSNTNKYPLKYNNNSFLYITPS